MRGVRGKARHLATAVTCVMQIQQRDAVTFSHRSHLCHAVTCVMQIQQRDARASHTQTRRRREGGRQAGQGWAGKKERGQGGSRWNNRESGQRMGERGPCEQRTSQSFLSPSIASPLPAPAPFLHTPTECQRAEERRRREEEGMVGAGGGEAREEGRWID
jgi:hypothetical protein